MKIAIAFVAVLLILASNAEAQRSNMTIGPRIGLTFTNVSGEDQSGEDQSSDNGTAFALGGELNYWFSPDLALMPQLLFVQKTAKNELTVLGSKIESSLTDSYIEIPVFLKYKVGSGATTPYFFAGPSFGLTVSSTSTATVDGDSETEDTENFAGSEISFNLGAGLSHQLDPKKTLVLDVLYSHGLTDLATNDSEVFHRGFRLMAGIQFAM